MNQLSSNIVKKLRKQIASPFGGYIILLPNEYNNKDWRIIKNQLATKGGNLEIRTIECDDTRGSVWNEKIISFGWDSKEHNLMESIKNLINSKL